MTGGLLRRVALACVALGLVTAAAAGCQPRKKPGPAGGAARQRLEVVAFYDDRQEKRRGDVLDLVERNRRLIDYLAPFWYMVRSDGTVVDRSERDVKEFARRNRISLEPLVTNENGTDAFLNNPALRSRTIRNLLSVLEREDYDGLSLDFQLLEPSSREGLTAFVEELGRELKGRRKRLSVDVIPFGEEQAEHEPYDLRAIGRAADQVVLMAYDRHGETTEPGPVAPLGWVRSVVSSALRQVPPDRLVLGLAAYGYDWPLVQGARGTPIPMKRIGEQVLKARAGERRARIRRDRDGSARYSYTDEKGTRHEVWFEDERSIVPKLRLARQRGLRGVAVWRVGYEDQRYWAAIADFR